MGTPGGQVPTFFTKNHPEYGYYLNNCLIWTFWYRKVTTNIHSWQNMMAIHQNELQNSGGDPYKCAPRGLNTHILTKNCPKYGIIQIIALFGWTFDNAKYPQIYIQDKACWHFFIFNYKTVIKRSKYGSYLENTNI